MDRRDITQKIIAVEIVIVWWVYDTLYDAPAKYRFLAFLGQNRQTLRKEGKE